MLGRIPPLITYSKAYKKKFNISEGHGSINTKMITKMEEPVYRMLRSNFKYFISIKSLFEFHKILHVVLDPHSLKNGQL